MGNGKFWQGVQKNPRSAERNGGKELMIHWSREVSRQLQIYFVLFWFQFSFVHWPGVSKPYVSLCTCFALVQFILKCFTIACTLVWSTHNCTQVYHAHFSVSPQLIMVCTSVYLNVCPSSVFCKRSTLLICTFDRSNFIIWAGAGFTTMPWLLSTKHQRTIHTSVFARNFFVQVSDIENPV